ncbi:cystinosin homolog [Anopheles cruzii]|uniref:cystinosin homolog n=1 Tax=Anopheles cruzii TaxID=68878 RepID=UPI0022EC9932|nr:cystinosin homolog [Anopheles cruzii]
MGIANLFSLVLTGLIVFLSKETLALEDSKIQTVLRIEPQSLSGIVGQTVSFSLFAERLRASDQNVSVTWNRAEALSIRPSTTIIVSECEPNVSIVESKYSVYVSSTKQGRFLIRPIIHPHHSVDDSRLFVQLKVAKYRPLIIVSTSIGWMYTLCWTVGDYIQVWTNYKRKSVVGLSFDFLFLNVVGNCCYATFNALLFWNHYVELEYFRRHPFGLNPVIANDVGYALHAVFGNLMLIAQFYLFPSDGNLVSIPVKILIGGCMVLVGVCSSLAFEGQMHWLDFLYVLSYVKLSSNLVKYVPQVYMNFKRKSTEGFSISNRIVDLIGGLLSLLQMILNSWNFDDWQSIGGSPVKFGLGFVSIFFDIVFMVQHYVCYKENRSDNAKSIP